MLRVAVASVPPDICDGRHWLLCDHMQYNSCFGAILPRGVGRTVQSLVVRAEGASHVQANSDRQPRRNRGAHHPRLPRDGHRIGRGVLRRGPARAARAQSRPRLPHRAGHGQRVVSQHRQDPRRRPAQRGGSDPSRLRLSVGERALRAGLPRRRREVHRPHAGVDGDDGLQDPRAPEHEEGGRAVCSRLGEGPGVRRQPSGWPNRSAIP